MIEYSQKEKELILKRLNEKILKSLEVNKYGKGTPLWMDLEFILDQFNQGNYYGTLELKILGTSCNDVKEKERTHKLLEIYGENLE